MEKVVKIPGLDKRNGVYRVRFRVPAEVIAAVEDNRSTWDEVVARKPLPFPEWKAVISADGSLREFVGRSLRTRDRKIALQRFREAAADYEIAFASIVAELTGTRKTASE